MTIYAPPLILSIDSTSGGAHIIKTTIRSEKKDVDAFLDKLKGIILSDSFDLEENFVLIRSNKQYNQGRFSTPYTMTDLDYDTSDVVDRLKELSVSEYSETLFDRDDSNPPLLFVFGKDISGKQIYIKLKIREIVAERVLCVSFHYAEHMMVFPYKLEKGGRRDDKQHTY